MKKSVLWAVATATTGALVAYAAKTGLLQSAGGKMKPALDKAKQVPIIAMAIDKVSGLRQPANDDLMIAVNQMPGDGGSIALTAQAIDNAGADSPEQAEAA